MSKKKATPKARADRGKDKTSIKARTTEPR